MGKYNKNAFSAFAKPQAGQIGKTGNVAIPGNTRQATIGMGLLSSASKEEIQKKWKDVVILNIDDVSENINNKYSQNEIEELAQNIYMIGLEQFFVVKPDKEHPGKFILLTGHRRFQAIRLLKERGLWGDMIPCTIKDPDSLNLPLSSEDKEKLAIMSTNIERRNNTEYDKLMEIRDYMDIVEKLKKAGYEELDGLKLRGVKTRKLISERYGMSEGTTAKFMRVGKNASEEVLNEMKEGNLTLNVANEIVKEDENVQKEIISKAKTNIQEEDTEIKQEMVDNAIKEIKQEENYILDKNEWEADTKDIIENLGILLSEKKYKKYKKAIEDIKKIICK